MWSEILYLDCRVSTFWGKLLPVKMDRTLLRHLKQARHGWLVRLMSVDSEGQTGPRRCL